MTPSAGRLPGAPPDQISSGVDADRQPSVGKLPGKPTAALQEHGLKDRRV